MDAGIVYPQRLTGASDPLPDDLMIASLEYALEADPVRSRDTATVYNVGAKTTLGHGAIQDTPAWRSDEDGSYIRMQNGTARITTPLRIGGWSSGTFAMLARFPFNVSPNQWMLADGLAGLTLSIRKRGVNNLDLQFQHHDGTALRAITAGQVIVLGKWQLIVCDMGPLGGRVYVDGVLEATGSDTTGTRAATADQSINALDALGGDMDFRLFAAWKNEQIGPMVNAVMGRRRRAA